MSFLVFRPPFSNYFSFIESTVKPLGVPDWIVRMSIRWLPSMDDLSITEGSLPDIQNNRFELKYGLWKHVKMSSFSYFFEYYLYNSQVYRSFACNIFNAQFKHNATYLRLTHCTCSGISIYISIVQLRNYIIELSLVSFAAFID